ncbi:MAG: enoyl-CoA hydratase/isomerase family protein [Pseudomonadota bacterium]
MTNQQDGFTVETSEDIAQITLNRPEKHNAFDDGLIASLTSAFNAIGADDHIRAVVLRAHGPSFSAGADANWMRRMAGYDEAENLHDAKALAGLMATIDGLPKPVIARVQGPAIGGGVGLVACSDIVVAADTAFFQLSEVKLGLTPSTISPFVIRAMGGRAARRYFLTAERMDATTAQRLGLVHEVVAEDALDGAVDALIGYLRKAGPEALAQSKQLVAMVRDQEPSQVADATAQQIAQVRVGSEAQEGLSAFLEKRKPSWVVE